MRSIALQFLPALLGTIACALPLQAASINIQETQTPQLQSPPGPLELTCWQEGEKVLEEKSLHDMTVSQALNEKVMSFSQGGSKEARLMVLTMGRSLCVVRSTKQ